MCTLLWVKLPGSSAKLPGPSCAKEDLSLQLSQLLPHSLTNIQDLFIVKGAMKLKELIYAYLATQNLEASTLTSFGRKQQLELSASYLYAKQSL